MFRGFDCKQSIPLQELEQPPHIRLSESLAHKQKASPIPRIEFCSEAACGLLLVLLKEVAISFFLKQQRPGSRIWVSFRRALDEAYYVLGYDKQFNPSELVFLSVVRREEAQVYENVFAQPAMML